MIWLVINKAVTITLLLSVFSKSPSPGAFFQQITGSDCLAYSVFGDISLGSLFKSTCSVWHLNHIDRSLNRTGLEASKVLIVVGLVFRNGVNCQHNGMSCSPRYHLTWHLCEWWHHCPSEMVNELSRVRCCLRGPALQSQLSHPLLKYSLLLLIYISHAFK